MVDLLFYGAAFWLACIVFTIDIIVPSGVAVGLGYVVVIIVGIWSPSRKYYFWASFFGTILIILGYFVSPMTEEPMHRYLHWKDISNRMLSIAIIWGAAFLLYRRYQGAVHDVHELKQRFWGIRIGGSKNFPKPNEKRVDFRFTQFQRKGNQILEAEESDSTEDKK